MKERPILFSAPMVRAIIADTKTQTRRVVKDEQKARVLNAAGYSACPYGQPGDRLWVREAWRIGAWNEDEGAVAIDYLADDHQRKEWISIPESSDPDGEVFKRLWEQSSDDAERAGINTDDDGRYSWEAGESPCRGRPSIHMPRWASRITLEIVNVRVERLHDVSRGDAMAEGCPFPNIARGANPREWYAELWDQINGPGSWSANPWVWVVEFKRVTP